MTLETLPRPPLALADRVGAISGLDDPWARYDRIGADTRAGIVAALGPDWSFPGKRVLDFGCGAGRTLRWFLGEAEHADVWGCDIDEASVAWLEQNLSPPLHVFVNGAEPPLPQPSGSFDLIWVISVFTHLTSSWSRWLLEMHRVLADDGLLFVTFMGRGMSEMFAHESWDESRVGMLVLREGQSWDRGGPMVLHSPWWIRSHWGRAFDIVRIDEEDAIGPGGQGAVLMRKRPGTFSVADLEALDPSEPREAIALQHNLDAALEEIRTLRAGGAGQPGPAGDLEARLRRAEGTIESLTNSTSWRMTAPLRSLRGAARRPR